MQLKKIYSGKVRDIYEIDDKTLLMVASDRLSAFDVILPDPIPSKGEILTQISNFWFDFFKNIIPNHLISINLTSFISENKLKEFIDRSVIVKKLKPVKCEAVVRGYLAGGGWQEYLETSMVSGIKLPKGLKESEKLDTPLFTPSTKADIGEHDEHISFDRLCEIIGYDLAKKVKEVSLKLYEVAASYAYKKGIIICDTKFEFGLDENNNLILMDEVLTPDSSRFWSLENYQIGKSQDSYDKQFVRDWLEKSGWNKKPPAPNLPQEVIQKTRDKYQEIKNILIG